VRVRHAAGLATAAGALALAAVFLLPAARAAVTPAPTAPAGAPSAGPLPGTPRERFKARFVGHPAPDFTLRDLHGGDVRLSALRGKVVLLNFWYSSCGPCRRETPDLIALHNLRAGQGLEILAVNLDDVLTPGTQHVPLKAFLQEFQVPYKVLLANDRVFDLYGGIPVQPMSFLVDRRGTVANVFWGAYPGPVLDKAIAPYLAAPAARP
jgi:peroxiredoxin